MSNLKYFALHRTSDQRKRWRADSERLLDAYRVKGNVYLLGSLERSLTVYSQQVRAHNLAWALREKFRGRSKERKFAVVGGGIGGLTVAAALLVVFPRVRIQIVERRRSICPLQQGSDTRWLHPNIYFWPRAGSGAPSAGLPILNWSEGRASDVVDRLLREFQRLVQELTRSRRRSLQTSLGVSSVVVEADSNGLRWKERGGKAKLGTYDATVLAPGFGLELAPGTPSYWRNEAIAQPELSSATQRYIVSGFGDGALVDLFRLRIERFRQDRLLKDIFQGLSSRAISRIAPSPIESSPGSTWATLSRVPNSVARRIEQNLKSRMRADTQVILHMRGRRGSLRGFREILDHRASFLNKLVLFYLHRIGGFEKSFDTLTIAKRRWRVPSKNVLRRYGVNPLPELLELFRGDSQICERLKGMEVAQHQKPMVAWPAGYFDLVETRA